MWDIVVVVADVVGRCGGIDMGVPREGVDVVGRL